MITYTAKQGVLILMVISVYLSSLVTAVAIFRNPNTIPFCLATDLLPNVLFSWLLVHLPSTLFNPLNPKLNPICYLMALLRAHHFLHVSRIRVKLLTFRLLMSYTYGAPILDVSRSYTTTHHSR